MAVAVTFLRSHAPYRAGETAAFEDRAAEFLLRRGIAQRVPEAKAEAKPEAEPRPVRPGKSG